MRVIFTAESATQLHHVRFTFLVSKPDSESADQRWPCGHFTWKILFQCELLKWAYQATSIVWEEETLSTALFQLNVKQKHNNDLLPYVKCSVHSTPSQKLVALSLQCLNILIWDEKAIKHLSGFLWSFLDQKTPQTKHTHIPWISLSDSSSDKDPCQVKCLKTHSSNASSWKQCEPGKSRIRHYHASSSVGRSSEALSARWREMLRFWSRAIALETSTEPASKGSAFTLNQAPLPLD